MRARIIGVSSRQVTIRSATEDDAAAIHAMILALGRATSEPARVKSRPSDFSQYGFGEDKLFEALIAERDSEAVGLCLFFLTFSSWLGQPGIYIQDLYVAPGERRTGLGRRLLGEAARSGRQRDATHLRLSVDAGNASAKAFYECLDMEHRDSEHTYHIGGTPFDELAGATK